MKEFKDLVFSPHPSDPNGKHAKVKFDNEYGISVIQFRYSYGGENGLYEIAVLGKDGNLTYETPVTSDVIGHLEPNQVTDIMKEIQAL